MVVRSSSRAHPGDGEAGRASQPRGVCPPTGTRVPGAGSKEGGKQRAGRVGVSARSGLLRPAAGRAFRSGVRPSVPAAERPARPGSPRPCGAARCPFKSLPACFNLGVTRAQSERMQIKRQALANGHRRSAAASQWGGASRRGAGSPHIRSAFAIKGNIVSLYMGAARRGGGGGGAGP